MICSDCDETGLRRVDIGKSGTGHANDLTSRTMYYRQVALFAPLLEALSLVRLDPRIIVMPDIDSAFGKKCVDVDLSNSFPGCANDDPAALATCLRDGIATQSCLALGESDGLGAALSGFTEACSTRGL